MRRCGVYPPNRRQSLKILHVIANLAPRAGGVPKACLELARISAARGHDVAVYTTNADGSVNVDGIGVLDVPLDRPVSVDGFEIRYFPVQFPRFWATSAPLARALSAAIPQADVVHIHALYFFHTMVAGALCRWHGVPYLFCPHGALNPYLLRRHRWRKKLMEVLFQDRVLRHAGAIHYASEEEMRLAAPYAHNPRGAVVANALDPSGFEPLPPRGELRRRHGEIGDRKVILFLGRLHVTKGLDVLARAFGRIARERDDVHLVVAGPDDGIQPRLEGWLQAEGVRHRATFTGHLEGRSKLAAFRDADIFVLPSYSESFGISAAEAMICGVPVVLSEHVNIWREVRSADAGIVARCDADEMAARVTELLDDPVRRRLLGNNGKALVRDRFSLDAVAHQCDAAYRAVIDGAAGALQARSKSAT